MLTARREPGEPAALQALYSHTASEVVVRYLIDSGVLYWWAWMHSTASWRVTCTQTGHVQQGDRQRWQRVDIVSASWYMEQDLRGLHV